MTTRKVILYSLIIPLAISVLYSIPSIEEDGLSAFWPIPCILALWSIGAAIGVIICVIVQKRRLERWFYITGQVIAYSSVLIFVYQKYLTEDHQLKFGNIEHNHLMVGLNKNISNNSYNQSYLNSAFLKLESEFYDPNSFYLNSFFTTNRDSVLPDHTETVYTVYFDYITTPYEKHLFSKVSVFEYQASIEIFNGDALHNEEYKYLKANEEQRQIEQRHELKEFLKDLPDTAMQQIRKSLEEK